MRPSSIPFRICKTCKASLPIYDFGSDSKARDGASAACIECERQRRKRNKAKSPYSSKQEGSRHE